MRLINKTAIITGSADGIGKAIAIKFAEQGANVVVCDINGKLGKNVVKLLNENAVFVKCDVSVEKDVNNVIKECIKHFKRIDILVNNAGIMNNYSIGKLKVEDWDRTMAINLRGVFLFSKAVMPYMRRQKSGKIINISS